MLFVLLMNVSAGSISINCEPIKVSKPGLELDNGQEALTSFNVRSMTSNMSVLISKLSDLGAIGVDVLDLDDLVDGAGPFICTEQKINQQECSSKELGLFMKLDHQDKVVQHVLEKNEDIAYPVVEEGVYCAVVYSDASSISEYSITTKQHNGSLRLDQYVKWVMLGQLVVPLCLVVLLVSTYNQNQRGDNAVLHYYCIAVFANKLSSAVLLIYVNNPRFVGGSFWLTITVPIIAATGYVLSEVALVIIPTLFSLGYGCRGTGQFGDLCSVPGFVVCFLWLLFKKITGLSSYMLGVHQLNSLIQHDITEWIASTGLLIQMVLQSSNSLQTLADAQLKRRYQLARNVSMLTTVAFTVVGVLVQCKLSVKLAMWLVGNSAQQAQFISSYESMALDPKLVALANITELTHPLLAGFYAVLFLRRNTSSPKQHFS